MVIAPFSLIEKSEHGPSVSLRPPLLLLDLSHGDYFYHKERTASPEGS